VVAHADLKEELQGRGSGVVRDFCLYRETSRETARRAISPSSQCPGIASIADIIPFHDAQQGRFPSPTAFVEIGLSAASQTVRALPHLTGPRKARFTC
jgi:hypothetical protein